LGTALKVAALTTIFPHCSPETRNGGSAGSALAVFRDSLEGLFEVVGKLAEFAVVVD
jgi:hypothetical protein